MKRMYVCNVEIRIEETLSLLKVKAGIKEKAKISITAITGNKQLQQAITADELRCYLLVRKSHGCINFCSLSSV